MQAQDSEISRTKVTTGLEQHTFRHDESELTYSNLCMCVRKTLCGASKASDGAHLANAGVLQQHESCEPWCLWVRLPNATACQGHFRPPSEGFPSYVCAKPQRWQVRACYVRLRLPCTSTSKNTCVKKRRSGLAAMITQPPRSLHVEAESMGIHHWC